MKKSIIIIVVILILAAVGYYFYEYKYAKAPSYINEYQNNSPYQQNGTVATSSQQGNSGQNNNTAAPNGVPPQIQTGGENTGSDIQVTEVDYNGTQFLPNPAPIKVNDYIFFVNKAGAPFWPMPAATETYAGFGPAQQVAAAGEYKFQFTKVGRWKIYDKLNPNATMEVVVTAK